MIDLSVALCKACGLVYDGRRGSCPYCYNSAADYYLLEVKQSVVSR